MADGKGPGPAKTLASLLPPGTSGKLKPGTAYNLVLGDSFRQNPEQIDASHTKKGDAKKGGRGGNAGSAKKRKRGESSEDLTQVPGGPGDLDLARFEFIELKYEPKPATLDLAKNGQILTVPPKTTSKKPAEERDDFFLMDLEPSQGTGPERQRLLGVGAETDGRDCLLLLDTSTDPPRLVLERIGARIEQLAVKGASKAAARIGLDGEKSAVPSSAAESRAASLQGSPPAANGTAKKGAAKAAAAASAETPASAAPPKGSAAGAKGRAAHANKPTPTPNPPAASASAPSGHSIPPIEASKPPLAATASVPAAAAPAPLRPPYAAKSLPGYNLLPEPEPEPEEETPPPLRPPYAAKTLPNYIPPPEVIEYSEASSSDSSDNESDSDGPAYVATPLGSETQDQDADLVPSVVVSAAPSEYDLHDHSHPRPQNQSQSSKRHLAAPVRTPRSSVSSPKLSPQKSTVATPVYQTTADNDDEEDFDLDALASDLEDALSAAGGSDSEADSVFMERRQKPSGKSKLGSYVEEDLDASSSGDDRRGEMVGGQQQRPAGKRPAGKRPMTLGGDEDEDSESEDG